MAIPDDSETDRITPASAFVINLSVRWTKIVGNVPRFLDRCECLCTDFFEDQVVLTRIRRRSVTGSVTREIIDDYEPLPYAVMQFGSDTFSLALLRCHQLLRESLLSCSLGIDLRDP